jgi:YD repeat-containing protein
MPYYSFHLNVPAQPGVVAERIRRIVSPTPTFWETLGSSWKRPRAPGSAFLGSVENLSFKIRRNIQYRNSFLPIIWGKIVPSPSGSRVNVFMYMHPFSLVFMLVWFGFLIHIESKLVDVNIARSFMPIGMAIFGLALSLGGFYFEALKVMPLLSEAVFNSEVATVPASNTESQFRSQSEIANAGLSAKRVGPAVAIVAVLIVLSSLFLHDRELRTNPVFETTANLLSRSAEAKAALGEPIKTILGIRGTVQDSALSGYALLAIPVSGPRHKGTVYVVANRMRTSWDIERAVFHPDAQSGTIDLTPPTQREAFQYPTTGRVYLLPLDDTAASDIASFPRYYKARLGIDVQMLSTQQLPAYTLDLKTKQVLAEKVVVAMEANHADIAEDLDAVILGVTSQDLNVQSSGWEYATNYRRGRFAVVSTARFHTMPWYAGSNPEAFFVRTRKMVTKNLALLRYPLDLNSDTTSAIADSVFTPSEADEMGESFRGEYGSGRMQTFDAPCVAILQGPGGKQAWRVGCSGEPEQDGRIESFETYSGIPLLVMSRSDFSFKDQLSFPFVRKYRPRDDRSRAFGIGATDSFDIFPVGDSATFSSVDLILADGARIHYARTSAGEGFVDAKLQEGRYMASPFSFSSLVWNGNGWDLATKDGWTRKFPSSGPDSTWRQGALIGIRSTSGKAISILRNSSSDLQDVRAPDGESIEFTSDAMHRITSGIESSGHAIQYEYDAAGRLVHVRDSQNGEEFYEYDPINRLTSVRNAQHQLLLLNTYGYLGEIQSQTLADGEKLVYESGFDQNQRLESLKLTLPNGYTIRWQLTRNGFIRSWPQPPADASAVLHR